MELDLFSAFGTAAAEPDSFIKPEKRKREKAVSIATNEASTIIELEPENNRKIKRLTPGDSGNGNNGEHLSEPIEIIDLEGMFDA